jgi:hypothetical protein
MRFSAPVQTGPAAYPTSYIMGTVSFPEVKQPVTGVDHPLPICAPKSGYILSRNNNLSLGEYSHKQLMNVDYTCDLEDGRNIFLHTVLPVCSIQW